ncbi:MAG: CoA-binding protein [Flavobacteriaceae bacterium]|nr:CoA-binding protein [Flavobacteriaceae bacterium]
MSKKTLVMGASMKLNRYSNLVIRRLRALDHEVLAFGIKEGEIEDVPVINELKLYEDINTITLYLNPERQKEYYDYMISLKPKRIIFNPGTENPEFYELLRESDIEIDIACNLVLLSTNQY